MPDPRQQVPVPPRHYPSPEPGLWQGDACPLCGATVYPSRQAAHAAWHAEYERRVQDAYTEGRNDGHEL